MGMGKFVLLLSLWSLMGFAAESCPRQAQPWTDLACDKIFDETLLRIASLNTNTVQVSLKENNCSTPGYNTLLQMQEAMLALNASDASLQSLIANTRNGCQARLPNQANASCRNQEVLEMLQHFNELQQNTLPILSTLLNNTNKAALAAQATAAACQPNDKRAWCKIRDSLSQLKDVCAQYNNLATQLANNQNSENKSLARMGSALATLKAGSSNQALVSGRSPREQNNSARRLRASSSNSLKVREGSLDSSHCIETNGEGIAASFLRSDLPKAILPFYERNGSCKARSKAGASVAPASVPKNSSKAGASTAGYVSDGSGRIPVLIDAGSSKPYTDSLGRDWSADFGFNDGRIVDRGPVPVDDTSDPDLYRTERWDTSGYTIPLANGNYTVWLHFAETYPNTLAEGHRVFSLDVEGKSLVDLDIFKEAGGSHRAIVKAFSVNVSDDFLNIQFTPNVQSTIIDAIEILPSDGEIIPSAAVALIEVGSNSAFTDTWGRTWAADSGFDGGFIFDRGPIAIENTSSPDIYRTERWGLSAYSLPIANGYYIVKLHFAETYTGITGVGQRVFSVDVEGTNLADLDIYNETGGRNRPLVKSFNAHITDGVLNIRFTAGVQSPIINGIEILAGVAPAAASSGSGSDTGSGSGATDAGSGTGSGGTGSGSGATDAGSGTDSGAGTGTGSGSGATDAGSGTGSGSGTTTGTGTTTTPAAPNINFSANPPTIIAGANTSLTWAATNATNCVASGGWRGNVGTGGNHPVNKLTNSTLFGLACSGPGGSTSATITINVSNPARTASPTGGPGGYSSIPIMNDSFGSNKGGANISSVSQFNPSTPYGINGTGWDLWMGSSGQRDVVQANVDMKSSHLEIYPTGKSLVPGFIVSHFQFMPEGDERIYIELRATAGRGGGAGTWGGFWFYPGNGPQDTYANKNEFDGLENWVDLPYGAKNAQSLYTNYYLVSSHRLEDDDSWSHESEAIFTDNDITSNWNTYGWEFYKTPDDILMMDTYFNGVKQKAITQGMDWTDSPPAILLGWNDGSGVYNPAVIKLDYVRAWKKDAAANSSVTTASTNTNSTSSSETNTSDTNTTNTSTETTNTSTPTSSTTPITVFSPLYLNAPSRGVTTGGSKVKLTR